MSEDKNQVLRLFKVAKELNVGTATVVSHLMSKGFEVKSAPNEKISPEMYDVLLREFASEKILKEKAELVREKKKEGLGRGEDAQGDEEEFLSAQQLRSGLLDKPEAEMKPPVKEAPKLKVLGKINLGEIGKPKKEEAPAEKVKPIEKEPVKEVPKQETPEAPVVEPVVAKKVEKVEKKTIEQPVEAKIESLAPETIKQTPEPAVEKEIIITPPNDEVTRIQAPKLSGLKVIGKIELPSKPSKESAGSSEEDKKRKRKRKRKPAPTTPSKSGTGTAGGAGQTGGANRTGGNTRRPAPQSLPPKKKEEVTDKQIQDQIKSTLAEIQKRADRSRQRLRREKRELGAQKRQEEELQRIEDSKVLEVTEFITANEFANMISFPVTEVISKCLMLGLFVSINQRLEADVISLLAEEYGYNVKFVDVREAVLGEDEEEEEEDIETRPPIITVMGHVDHGKTSLLDHIRKTNVIAGEAGGITQHIGAYEVILADGRKITFLDTPGHEAFTAMRARGAKVTDVAIIVIAADDSVMPQTREAINHAQAAGVPMVFAINKIDKPGANSEKIKEQLSAMNILVEDWGGKFQCQEISAKKGEGITELLDKVLLEAEMLNLKANKDKQARGTVIEAKVDKGRGILVTMLVQNGTLRVGDNLVVGVLYGRVKALMDERGKRIESAGPSNPAMVLGLSGVPQAGDKFLAYEDEKEAKEVAVRRAELFRQQTLRQHKHISLEEIGRRKAKGDFKELNIIVKGDVDGSVEALSDSLLKLSGEEVAVNIVMKAVGQITESDVLLASASDAIIVGFQVRPSPIARKLAETEGIDIRLYRIIYDAINDVKDALSGLLSPEIKEEYLGTAEVREVFKITKVGTIAGCMITDGKILRSEPVRVVRDGIVVYEGKLSSLKRFKDDVKEVKEGFDCGIGIDGYPDIKAGDHIESYKESEVKRTL